MIIKYKDHSSDRRFREDESIDTNSNSIIIEDFEIEKVDGGFKIRDIKFGVFKDTLAVVPCVSNEVIIKRVSR